MAAKLAKIQVLRRIVLGITLIGMTVLTFLHQRSAAYPSIDALDPFGGLETMMKYVAGGEFLKKIEPGNIVLFGAVVVLGIVLSRFFCGWLCAFGALQGVFGALGKKIFRRRFTVPAKLDKVLRYAKYVALAAIVFLTWRAGELVIRPYDPLAAYGHLAAGLSAVWAEFAVGLVLLVATLILSMLYERAFCKYLCPLGAFNAILSRVPLFRIKRVESTCISCSKCDRVCPMNIEVSKAQTVGSSECIACLECVTACPTKKGTLATTLGGKALKAGAVVAIGLAIYAAAAAIGQASGMLRFTAPTLTQMAATKPLAVEDIKGSSTYGQVAEAFGLELSDIYRALGVDGAKLGADTMIKDTGKVLGIEGFEADAVRVAVAKLLGLPYAGEKGAAAKPESPAPDKAPATAPAQAAAPASAPVKAEPAKAPAPTSAKGGLVVPADFALEGTMSVKDLAAALSATPEAIIDKLKLPAAIPQDKPLRDLKDEYGFSMSDLKTRIKE
jgi:ferredoxin